jgi:hypothetical protein
MNIFAASLQGLSCGGKGSLFGCPEGFRGIFLRLGLRNRQSCRFPISRAGFIFNLQE